MSLQARGSGIYQVGHNMLQKNPDELSGQASIFPSGIFPGEGLRVAGTVLAADLSRPPPSVTSAVFHREGQVW